VSAVISSMAGAVAVVIVDPMTFNLDTGMVPLLKVMVVFGIIAFANYLKNNPVPKGMEGP
jgi:hypothetical protein